MTTIDASTDAFIHALPKVELHVHLVGSASVATVLELSRRHPGSGVPSTEEELRRFYTFRDFPHFARVYRAVNQLVREPEDVATLVLGLARDLASQGARYAELQVTPYAHHIVGMPMREITEALDLAAARSLAEHGVEMAYIFDIPGEFGEEAAKITLDHALQEPPTALVGFGIGGIEQERLKYRDAFRSAFSAARAAGLHSVPHGGEMTGPETIWEVIEGYGAERIGHGINCLADTRLVAYLRDTQLPWTSAPPPTSARARSPPSRTIRCPGCWRRACTSRSTAMTRPCSPPRWPRSIAWPRRSSGSARRSWPSWPRTASRPRTWPENARMPC